MHAVNHHQHESSNTNATSATVQRGRHGRIAPAAKAGEAASHVRASIVRAVFRTRAPADAWGVLLLSCLPWFASSACVRGRRDGEARVLFSSLLFRASSFPLPHGPTSSIRSQDLVVSLNRSRSFVAPLHRHILLARLLARRECVLAGAEGILSAVRMLGLISVAGRTSGDGRCGGKRGDGR